MPSDPETKKLDYESQLASPATSPTSVVPLRVPHADEYPVCVLTSFDSSDVHSTKSVLAKVGIPSEAKALTRKEADDPKTWRPGMRRLFVWSADEVKAVAIVEELRKRREKIKSLPRGKPTSESAGGDGFDGGWLGGIDGIDIGDIGGHH